MEISNIIGETSYKIDEFDLKFKWFIVEDGSVFLEFLVLGSWFYKPPSLTKNTKPKT